MGPPILMLVTYGVDNARAVLYFHWSKGGKLGGKKRGRRNRSYEDEGERGEDPEDSEVRALVEVLRVKEEWVKAIHQVFFPLRSTLVSKAAR